MTIGFLFWLLMVLWFFSWVGTAWGSAQWPWFGHVNNLLFFVLLFLIGWKIFGFVIQS